MIERLRKFGQDAWRKVGPTVDKTIGRSSVTRLFAAAVGLILLFLILNFMGIGIFEATGMVAAVVLAVIFYRPLSVVEVAKTLLKREIGRTGAVILAGSGWLVAAVILAVVIHEWTISYRWILLGIIVLGTGSWVIGTRYPRAARWVVVRGIPGFLALVYVPILLTLRPVEFTVTKTETVMETYRVLTDHGAFENEPNPWLGHFYTAELQGELEEGIGQRFRGWKTGIRLATARLSLYPKLIWAEQLSANPPWMPVKLVEVLVVVIAVPAVTVALVLVRARKRQAAPDTQGGVVEKSTVTLTPAGRQSLLPERLRPK